MHLVRHGRGERQIAQTVEHDEVEDECSSKDEPEAEGRTRLLLLRRRLRRGLLLLLLISLFASHGSAAMIIVGAAGGGCRHQRKHEPAGTKAQPQRRKIAASVLEKIEMPLHGALGIKRAGRQRKRTVLAAQHVCEKPVHCGEVAP